MGVPSIGEGDVLVFTNGVEVHVDYGRLVDDYLDMRYGRGRFQIEGQIHRPEEERARKLKELIVARDKAAAASDAAHKAYRDAALAVVAFRAIMEEDPK